MPNVETPARETAVDRLWWRSESWSVSKHTFNNWFNDRIQRSINVGCAQKSCEFFKKNFFITHVVDVVCSVPSRGTLVSDGHRVVGWRLRPGRKVRLLHSRVQDGEVDEESYHEVRKQRWRRLDTLPVLRVKQDVANKVCSLPDKLFHCVWWIKPAVIIEFKQTCILSETNQVLVLGRGRCWFRVGSCEPLKPVYLVLGHDNSAPISGSWF